ncbi:hypothetical protein CAPTEDRAFT_156508 [Capitella teleta]|uniref:Ribosome assembly factor mrt4 n=1 Tax=Capitella teleta TaxID=283909 RepID=R7UV50_CAPTE|nr:hypothetical protein CAPTEDRAFT_156508 [Capitella teleta]|eukprot:ELU10513.1 hypothetical protein CAPTEDRAFT_156508 [Capitella teleta]
MPKSKRDKKISLTQTNKKGLELKQKLIEDIHNCVDQYARIFLFSVQNMRNTHLKDVRQEWKHSRFFFGKNKVMSFALGQTPETEYRDALHKLTRKLQGQVGLLFTNSTKEEVIAWFEKYSEPDFARSGNEATQTVTIDEGPLASFSHSMEPQLRQLGLPTTLKKGVVTLTQNYEVCKLGQTLTPEQARILKLFDYKMANFAVSIEGLWSNDGSFETLDVVGPASVVRANKIRITDSKKDGEEHETSFVAHAEDDSEEDEMSDE